MTTKLEAANAIAAWGGLILAVLAIFRAFGIEAFKAAISTRMEAARSESAKNLEQLKSELEHANERFKGFHSVLAKEEIDTYKRLWASTSIAIVALNRISDDINPWTLADLYKVDKSEIESYECKRAIELKARYLKDTTNDLKEKVSAADEIAYASRPFISKDVWSEVTELHKLLIQTWIDLEFRLHEKSTSDILEQSRSSAEIKVENISETISRTIRVHPTQ